MVVLINNREMENVNKLDKGPVSTGWIKTTKEAAVSTGSNQAPKVSEEKIVSRVAFEQDPSAQVSFNTYQDILNRRNQMLGTVKPSLYQYDAD